MKLIIKNDRIAATATDDYNGPEKFIAAPADLDVQRLVDYRMVDGQLVIPAPAAVSMRQARLALLAAGKLQAVNDAIAAMPGDQGEAARIEWEYATEVRRDSPLVAGLADALSFSPAELDALFVQAAAL